MSDNQEQVTIDREYLDELKELNNQLCGLLFISLKSDFEFIARSQQNDLPGNYISQVMTNAIEKIDKAWERRERFEDSFRNTIGEAKSARHSRSEDSSQRIILALAEAASIDLQCDDAAEKLRNALDAVGDGMDPRTITKVISRANAARNLQTNK